MRAPTGLYRAGFGFIFGNRLMMLEHTGRSSGARRFVVLEIVTRPSRDEVAIASALGRSAQWFLNLMADPNCYVSVGPRCRVPAIAGVLGSDESARFLAAYQAEHPALWKKLESIIASLHDGEPDFELPVVRVALQPLTADRETLA